MPLAIIAGPGSRHYASSGSPASQYDFTPTHYATASASGGGNGSLGSPWTAEEAFDQAVAGNVVEFAPGTYSGTNTGDSEIEVWPITNAGTSGNPIIFYARNAASLTTSNRSILEHSGTVQGSGCPLLILRTDEVQIHGFYINEDDAPTHPDGGPIVIYAQNCEIGHCRISRGASSWPSGNNHCAIFSDGPATGTSIHDNWIEGYNAAGEGGVVLFSNGATFPTNSNGQWTVRNNYFVDCVDGFYIKGAGPARPMGGGFEISHNVFNNCDTGINVSDSWGATSGYGRNRIYQNIFVDCIAGVRPRAQGADIGTEDIDIVNNTAIRCSGVDAYSGLMYDYFLGDEGTGWRIQNNIAVDCKYVTSFPDVGNAAVSVQDYNCGNGNIDGWAFSSGTGYANLTTWRASAPGTGKDANSITSDPLLTSETYGAVGFAKLGGSSPCLNAGVDILNLKGGGTSAPINMGAYILTDQSDQIGIRS